MSRSKLVPFIPGEAASDRHGRRLVFNLRREHLVKDWATKCGINLWISNRGHHWRFKKGKAIAEWWPSSARLVRQQKYDNPLHVHDYHQAIASITKHFQKFETEDA